MVQAWTALRWFHSAAELLHLDMKPNNMIWSRVHQRLSIVDFSLVEPWPVPAGHEPHGVYCTLPYRAPEIIVKVKRTALPALVRPALDWWALGCAAWELAAGHARFSGGQDDINCHVAKWNSQLEPQGWLPQRLANPHAEAAARYLARPGP